MQVFHTAVVRHDFKFHQTIELSKVIPKLNMDVFFYNLQLPINKLTDHLRKEMAAVGFTEVLTFALVCCP